MPTAKSGASFDDLVDARQDRLGNGEAERLRGLEVDYQLECRRLLDRQIGRIGARENAADIGPGLANGSREARSVADQPAGLCEFTPIVHRRNGMTCCQRHELLAPAVEAGHNRSGMQLDEGWESSVDLAFGAGLQEM